MSWVERFMVSYEHLDTGIVFSPSFHFEEQSTGFTLSQRTGVATQLMNGMAQLLLPSYRVIGVRSYATTYGHGADGNQWKDGTAQYSVGAALTGTRATGTDELAPLGLGLYVSQNDQKVGGRKGRIILKIGFYVGSLNSNRSTWSIDPTSTNGTELLDEWADVVSDTGYWGKSFTYGTQTGVKMVNLHKGDPTPRSVDSMSIRYVNKYKVPEPPKVL